MRNPHDNLKRMKEASSLFIKTINRLWSLDPAEMSRYNLSADYLPSYQICKQLACSSLMKSNPNEVQFIISTILALNSIPNAEAEVVWDDFFSNNSVMKSKRIHYSRSGFYRLREKGINNFFYIVDSTSVVVPPEES